jgi:stress response protein YsnF
VRKTVRTERESVEVPTRREEVTVDRVPVEGEAFEGQIGDDASDPASSHMPLFIEACGTRAVGYPLSSK